MQKPIPLSSPVFDGRENELIQKAVQSGQIATTGAFIEKFENKFSQKLKTHQLVALNSGTSALHLALLLLNVGSGDEVICQSFTFCASANPIVYLGATPIFVDSEEKTWNICPEILEDTILDRLACGKKPKAVISVDLFGMPAQYDKLVQVCEKYGIPLIEDAAEAVGSKFQGQHCGTFGDIGIYSFNGNKIITTGSGGGLITSDLEQVARTRYFANQARENIHYYQHLAIGYNYRMTNLSAGIGLAQLETLASKIKQRRAIFENYQKLFKPLEGFTLLAEPENSFCNRWLTTVLIDPKKTGFTNNELRMALRKEKIETRFLWKPLHLQPVFKKHSYFGGNTATRLYHTGLCLPSSSQLTFEDQLRVVALIVKQYQKVS